MMIVSMSFVNRAERHTSYLEIIMSSGNVHVVPHREGWAVKSEGRDRAASVYDTQSGAIAAAREIAP